MKIRFTGLFLLASLFLLSACGQKGPLYLEKGPAPAAAPARSDTTVDTDKDSVDSRTEKTDSDMTSDKKE